MVLGLLHPKVECGLIGPECCVYVPDGHHNVSEAFQALASESSYH